MTAKTLSPWAQDAANVRRAIAAARRDGALGDLPKDVKISVTCASFSGGSSITILVSSPVQSWGWVTGRPSASPSTTPPIWPASTVAGGHPVKTEPPPLVLLLGCTPPSDK